VICITRQSSFSRYAPWTALPLLVLCMASPLSHKTINNKSAAVCGVIRRNRFYLSLVNIMDSQPLAGSPATRKVLSFYFNVFFPGAISWLAVSASAFRSLWLAINQFAVPVSSVCWPYINGPRCVTWS